MKKKNVLIVVDMQNDFIDGALGSKEAVGIVDNVINAIQDDKYDEIFVTKDTHEENYLETREGKFLPVKHCIRYSHGWELNNKVRNALNNLKNKTINVITKPSFGSLKLIEKLKEKADEIDSITLIGLCTDICVVSNALMIKNTFPELNIRVLANCCAGVTPEKHKAALDTMESCQIEILNR